MHLITTKRKHVLVAMCMADSYKAKHVCAMSDRGPLALQAAGEARLLTTLQPHVNIATLLKVWECEGMGASI